MTPTPIPRARTTDPQTSRDAARSVKKVNDSMRAVFKVLRAYGPLTDEELVDRYERIRRSTGDINTYPQQSVSGLRTRRRELWDRGYVINTEMRRPLRSGRNGIVWAVRPGLEHQEGGTTS